MNKPTRAQLTSTCILIFSTLFLSGCASAYYAAMEKAGVHKRDIMVDRVEQARDAQQNAQEQFQTALQQLQELTQFDGGDLQRTYEATQKAYERSNKSAGDVSDRIDRVASVSNALFKEWDSELEQISNTRLRQDSASKLRATQDKYQKLMQAMRRAEAKMDPVLTALKDNTLYLKHNLNAAAIGSLEQEYKGIQSDIHLLIAEMNKSIQQSNEFIATLQGSK